MSHRHPDSEKRRLPTWLVGLLIAAVVFVLALILFQALGYGDDPVIDPNAAPHAWGALLRPLAA